VNRATPVTTHTAAPDGVTLHETAERCAEPIVRRQERIMVPQPAPERPGRTPEPNPAEPNPVPVKEPPAQPDVVPPKPPGNDPMRM
jgi:hypothetical protein